MSGWNWIHAGLEIATYAKAQEAQRQLSEMQTAVEIEAARKFLLDAMRTFVFDISRDIQLAEEQIEAHPQQVYIVSKSLDWRLGNSGLSPEIFPDFQDKEYFFKTQRKIQEVIKQATEKLSPQQIRDSDIAIQYISELPVLQKAMSSQSAQESLRATDKQWGQANAKKGNKNLFFGLGVFGFILTLCVGTPLGIFGLASLLSGDVSAVLAGLAMLCVAALFPVGSVAMMVLGSKFDSNYSPLKEKREIWKNQLMSKEDWQGFVSTFGNLSSAQIQRMYDERLSYLTPLLGGDFQRYLTPGEQTA
ncbi:MAG: hypothetical protein KGZ86_00845 [Candidatus Latescibacteria bacterium]|nr:hypothetical protein [Candidatus Latescibacterota bacterium]